VLICNRLEKLYGTSTKNMNSPGTFPPFLVIFIPITDNAALLTMHEDYVKRVIPKERLFFFDVNDRWEPLCKILNCPVPDESFPRANDANSMQEFFENIFKAAVVRWLQIFAVSGVATAMGWYAWKRT
jgi:hypothetical protein